WLWRDGASGESDQEAPSPPRVPFPSPLPPASLPRPPFPLPLPLGAEPPSPPPWEHWEPALLRPSPCLFPHLSLRSPPSSRRRAPAHPSLRRPPAAGRTWPRTGRWNGSRPRSAASTSSQAPDLDVGDLLPLGVQPLKPNTYIFRHLICLSIHPSIHPICVSLRYLPIKTGQQNTHTKVSTEHNTECLINISKYKFSLLISGLTTVLKNVNNMRIFGEAAEKNLYLSQLIILDTLEKCLAGQPKDTMRLDETMLVKQLLPETCHFLHTCREGNQHAAELRNSASGVLFSLSCNNFNAVFSCISTRLQELTVCSEDNVDVHDIELLQYINVDCAKLKRLLKECAEKLFDLVDGFAESTKRKAAVWPPQIILLILCPEIIQDISKDVVDENNMNKVRRAKLFPLYLDVKQFILLEVCITLGLLFKQSISGNHLNYHFRFLCLMDLEETYSYIILFGRGKIIPGNDQRFKIIP
ncbi:uncharacterized protein LOC129017577, partial [Pongo pygmaeus]|uniref:uncharacterized protein LOC129017577 n=1 Tax=Pongo pygmaeus TaxID=9600 RepID=UPI00300D969F